MWPTADHKTLDTCLLTNSAEGGLKSLYKMLDNVNNLLETTPTTGLLK